ncbi:MAG: mechanosensitive ion channel family protein [Candidatus Methanospirareceae archaeon]
MVELIDTIMESFATAIGTMIEWIPAIIAAAIILLIGWFAGKFAGKIVGTIIDKIGLGPALDKTIIGDVVKSSGITTAKLFDILVRWFIYIIFIMAAINVLGIALLIDFMNKLVLYIPHLIAGILLLVVGLILVDFVMDWLEAQLKTREVGFGDIVVPILRALFTLLILTLALDQMLIDTEIIYTFLVPLAWGLGIGLAVALGIALGWGGKDIVADYLKDKWGTK